VVSFKHPNLHILHRSKGGQQMKRLKDEADLLSTVGGRIGEVSDGVSTVTQSSRAGRVECTKYLKQSGFSTADRADDRYEFAFAPLAFSLKCKAIPTESCSQRSFQILACYSSNRTDPYASIVLVDCTADRQVGFSQVVI
jgi:hypothetical protein